MATIYGQEEAVRMADEQMRALQNVTKFELDNMSARTNSLADISDALCHIAKYGIICYHIHLTTDNARDAFALGRSIQLQNLIDPLQELNPGLPPSKS